MFLFEYFIFISGICAEKCLNGGKCVQKDTCECPKGYFGLRCEFCKWCNSINKIYNNSNTVFFIVNLFCFSKVCNTLFEWR